MKSARTFAPGIVGIVVASVVCGPSVARGAPVTLQNATATFSQTSFTISQTIDGNTGGTGWAIDPNEVDQIAVWETQTDVGGPMGTGFTFTLYNNFNSHALGRFRISVTSDLRTTFADSAQSGGDVTATWTQLTPLTAVATGGPTLTILGDNSILAGGADPATTVYTVTASTLQTGITGIRLEAMEDPSLPFNGPGRQGANGNFVLNEFEVAAVDLPEPAGAMLLLAATALLPRRRLFGRNV